MFIKFANTNGTIYDYERSSLDSTYELGTMLTYDDGIIIIDRLPLQETTQLNVDTTIKTLRYALKNMYPLQTNEILIYLPRMDSNISKQAEIQSQFSKMITKEDQTLINYLNITLVHL